MKFIMGFVILCFSICSFGQTDTTIIRIEKQKSEKKKAKLYLHAAQRSWQTGEFEKTLTYTKKGLDYCAELNDPKIEAQLYNDQGIAYDYLGNYPAALKSYFKALKIQDQIDYPNLKAYIYSNIGLIYSNQSKAKLALEYHNKSLEIRKHISDLSGVSASLNNIAIVYVMLGNYPAALENYMECIRYDEKVGDDIGLSDDYNNIGLCYMEMKKYEQAETYFFKALELREKLESPLNIAQCYGNIAILNYNSGNFDIARSYFNKCIEIGEKIRAKELLRLCYETLSKLEIETNNSEAAFENYKLFIAYRDSIDNSENTRLQTELELNYKFEKEKEAERLIREKKEAQDRIILYAISIGFCVIMVFSILLFRRWKQTNRQKKIIEEKNKLVELKNEEILDSITYAKRIQSAMLPSKQTIDSIFKHNFIIYFPKDIVAGDFYWLETTLDKSFFAVADCTGHGVPGALMSVVCHNALNRSVREYGLEDPGKILDQTRNIIINELGENNFSVSDGMDVSLCVFENDFRTLKWAGANNPLWIYRNSENDFFELKPDKQPIGRYDRFEPFKSHTIELKKGDRIYLFSDGFADQFGGQNGKKMMKRNFQTALRNTVHLDLAQQKLEMESFYKNWKGDLNQIDDVCLACIEISE